MNKKIMIKKIHQITNLRKVFTRPISLFSFSCIISLGTLLQNKMFMHGLPMKLAPKVQYEIPFLVWTSKDFRDYKSDLPEVLEQHYIFHSVLNLLSIESPAYNKDFDIFK